MHRTAPNSSPNSSTPSTTPVRRGRSLLPFAARRQPSLADLPPTWRQARPARIAASLEAARARSAGGWFVVGASGDLGSSRSLIRTVAGRELALWRAADGSVRASGGACPHLGALLVDCPVVDGKLVCTWHGMRLGDGEPGWSAHPAVDDGALLWVRLAGIDDGPLTAAPAAMVRPPLGEALTSVLSLRGACTPDDVIANRLDPWHGAWFHPYAFSHLTVDDANSSPEELLVDVTFRLGRRVGVPVRAKFWCPDARTVVMEIVEGEGLGSVVETHATPLTAPEADTPVSVVTELVVAHSDRRGFGLARQLGWAIRPMMRHTSRRLWVDDLAYAERRSLIRRRGDAPD